MPWPALEYSNRDLKAKLSSTFNVNGIPTLVILDENDNIVTVNGRAAVARDPDGAGFPWKPKDLQRLDEDTVEVRVC